MKMFRSIALTAMLPMAVFAEQSVKELPADESPLTGEAELGFNQSTGNTETDSFIGRLKLEKEFMKWQNQFKFEALRSSEDGEKTQQNFLAEFQSNRKLNDKEYLFGNLRVVDDEFGGFRRQSSATFGYGRKVIDNEKTSLNLEGGLGYRHSEEQDTGDSFGEPVALGRASWGYQWTETTKLTNELRVEGGPDNTYVENDFGARVKINGHLGLKVSYIVRHNTDVPVGTEKTDTLTAVTLGYTF